ncbi:lactosylceramide 4-alpha-galactosyltransferase-like [Amblyomma americanum]
MVQHESLVENSEEKSGFSRIFFLETGGRGTLSPRFACAVESAARLHPGWTVHLLSTSGGNATHKDTSGPFVDVLRSIPNVVLSYIKPVEEFQGTPLEAWYRSGVLNKSSHPVEHLADALRLAVLYKRGGVYLDLDVVVIRPLDPLPSFVCQSPVGRGDMVSNGFLAFNRGDPFLLALMERAARTYKPEQWASIGPLLLRHVTLTHCGRRHVEELVGRRCGGDAGFTVLPHWMFLAVPAGRWKAFFAADASNEVWLMCTSSYALHVYNKLSSRALTEPGSAYRQAAQVYCPDSLQLALHLGGAF